MNRASETAPAAIRIAVVGGGGRCHSLLKVLHRNSAETAIKATIIGVADIDPHAAGFAHARAANLFTTDDYRKLFDLPGVDLVVNLTGSRQVGADIASSAPEHVPVLSYPAAVLFQEFIENVLNTDQRVAMQADEIHRAKAFMGAVAQATIVGVMTLDANYRIRWINRAGARMAGLSASEALGRYCFQVTHQQIAPCEAPKAPCPMKQTLRTGETAHAIHEHRTADGGRVFCDVTTFPIFSTAGEVVEVIEFIRDITADLNNEMERRTRMLKNDLARLVQEDKLLALGKMVASVAHEINNPIASIINFTKLMRDAFREGPPSPEQVTEFERYMDLSLREAQRCGNIVSNLLSFSRQQRMAPKRIDLAAMLDDVITLIRHKMTLANISLERETPTTGLDISGDTTQIQQCLVNLVFNALEAMPQGGRLTIRGALDTAANQVRLEVEDTGVGISKDNLPNIFEPFFTTKADGHGVGLGLSMVYGIIREHRGSITVHSVQGKGTTFRVTLPAAEAMEAT
jgi:two-component system NtrC family sensor kinase